MALRTLSSLDVMSEEPKTVDEILQAVEEAFGPHGPGILLVDNLCEEFENDRLRLFQGARALAGLSTDELRKLEFPELEYAVGWSRGRERFKGVVDLNKGSFYANPLYDDPAKNHSSSCEKYMHYNYKNYWPQQPSCANVEKYFKKVGRYINQIGIHIARHCDLYLQRKIGEDSKLPSFAGLLKESRAAKGRLLHYFPTVENDSVVRSNGNGLWCAYHNDHGLLTGLVSASYYENNKLVPTQQCPDDTAGLYIMRRDGDRAQKVSFPPHCLAFQIGETAQILSGGLLRATPHAVMMPKDVFPLSRVSFAMFMSPNPDVLLPLPHFAEKDPESTLQTHACIPPLSKRYETGDTTGSFSARTFKAYYD